MNKEQLYMVFDVESVGLHGEGFAVGFVVINGYGVEVTGGLISCPSSAAQGTDKNREWTDANIPVLETCPNAINKKTPQEVRNSFWSEFMSWKKRGAILVADCSWPVEHRFLEACVEDDASREWEGPYPLHDLASVLLTRGKNPLDTFPRLTNELPAHNPLNDARQSARILIAELNA